MFPMKAEQKWEKKEEQNRGVQDKEESSRKDAREKENVMEECSVVLHWLEENLALMQRVWAKKFEIF